MKASLRWGAVLVGAALIVAAGWPLFERFLGRKRLRFPYLARPIPQATYDALAAEPGWAKSELRVAPGITLRGLLRRSASKTAPWVLFYPGNDESQLERGQAFLKRLAGDTDWGLAVFAYRGYDASDGKAELSSLRADAPEIFAKLCQIESLSASRVHLAGFSIGGHFSVHAAGVANRRGQRAASLTLLASVDDIIMFQPSRWERLSRGEDYQTQPFLNDVPAPVLVVQGTADEALAGPQQGRDIARALGARATYQELEGVKHVPLLENAVALESVRAFIRSHAQP